MTSPRSIGSGTFCSVARSAVNGVVVAQDDTHLSVYVEILDGDLTVDASGPQVWRLRYPGEVYPFTDPHQRPHYPSDIDTLMDEHAAAAFRLRALRFAHVRI
jgi:hypothetical protein